MKSIPNFKNKSTFGKLERQAYDGTIDVSNFPPAEYWYFSELRKIYYAFKFEKLPKESASRKKSVLFRQYKEALAEQERCRIMYKQYQENIRIAERNLSKIEKSQDVTEMAMLALETLGCMMGEASFFCRQKRKLEGLK